MPLSAPAVALLSRSFLLLIACTFLAALATDVAHGTPSPGVSFALGERFTYRVSWMGLHAATAVMEAGPGPKLDGRETLQFVTTATSSPFVTKFYAVNNRVESIVDAETLLPKRLLFHRREGRRKNDFDVTFHRARGNVLSIKDGVPATIPIPAGTHDSISCLYAIRSAPILQPGFSQFMTVHHDKKNYRLEVRIEAIEKVRGPWGEVEAIRALAIMPFQGIFLNEGNIRVWFTNDDRRIPVKMKAKVIVGSVVADLLDGFGVNPLP